MGGGNGICIFVPMRFGSSGSSGFAPPVVQNLIIINGLLFLFYRFSPLQGVSDFMDQYLILHAPGAYVDAHFYPWQLVTYMFMHSQQDIFHLLFNMFSLWMFGSLIEQTMGSKRFLNFYLIAGLSGAALHLLLYSIGMSLGWATYTPSILGASAAVYGILLAFAHYFPRQPIHIYFVLPIQARYFVALMIGMDVFYSIAGTTQIAHIAHLGGALGAFVFLHFFKIKRWFK